MSSSRTVNDDFSPVSELSVRKKLCSVNPAKAQGPDSIPGWLLKENADLLTPTPTHHGYHEYLLLGRLGALILERSRYHPRPQTKTYPRHQQAPLLHFPYAYLVQDCRGSCCSWPITIFQTTSYAWLLTFYWIGDRVKLAQDCFSECRYRTVHPSRCSSGDKVRAVALFNND